MAVDEVAGRTPAVPPPAAGRPVAVERARPKREREEEVLVWPDLVFIEFIAAVLFTLTFIVLSVFIDAPLLNRANPDITPNPSGRMTLFPAAYATVVTWILVLFDAGKFERITRWFPGLTPVEEQRQVEVSPGGFETARESVTKGFLSTKDLAKGGEWSIGKR